MSARLAADAILGGRPEGYERALSASLDQPAGASWKAKRAADRFPRACLWAVRAPGVFDALAGLLAATLLTERGSSPRAPATASAVAPRALGTSGSLT